MLGGFSYKVLCSYLFFQNFMDEIHYEELIFIDSYLVCSKTKKYCMLRLEFFQIYE